MINIKLTIFAFIYLKAKLTDQERDNDKIKTTLFPNS